jgi:predicted HTH transcriptional regulator
MPSNICLGCRTYFEEGERVPLESMFIEFKNYYLPLKESKQKWIILKTITGFLNSKGGTIYIGVEDKKGEVMGLELSRK